MYAEYFMDWQLISDGSSTPYVDGGITKLLSNDSVDIYAGYDLSETFGTRLPTTGCHRNRVSYRFH